MLFTEASVEQGSRCLLVSSALLLASGSSRIRLTVCAAPTAPLLRRTGPDVAAAVIPFLNIMASHAIAVVVRSAACRLSKFKLSRAVVFHQPLKKGAAR